MRFFPACLLLCLLSGCYEDRSGCLDPDASNYDLLADDGCTDCCTYPEISVRVSTVWEDSAIVVGRTYTDGADNPFQFVRFRYYLGDLRLEAAGSDLPDPRRPVTVKQRVSGDSTLTVNGNYLLATIPTTTTRIGFLSDYGDGLTALSGTYGLGDRFRNILPASAPTGDALRTQAGLLNFNDGNGYVQAKLEYTRGAGGDTLVSIVYGSLPFELPFGQVIQARRGFGVRVDLQARLKRLFDRIDLSQGSSSVATAVGQGTDFLRVTGLEL